MSSSRTSDALRTSWNWREGRLITEVIRAKYQLQTLRLKEWGGGKFLLPTYCQKCWTEFCKHFCLDMGREWNFRQKNSLEYTLIQWQMELELPWLPSPSVYRPILLLTDTKFWYRGLGNPWRVMVTMPRAMLSTHVRCDRDCRWRLPSQTPHPQCTSRHGGRKT